MQHMITRVVAVVSFLMCAASLSLAHAVLVEATPPVNGRVAGPEVDFRLRFNSRIDGARSVLSLVLPDGTVRALGVGKNLSADTLSIKADHMQSGHYTLRWQVLAVDGHITRGEVPFEVR
jgi:methionine-rich copper-binding protein CopC